MVRPDYREIKHNNELYHYGMPERSGRFKWGSGKRPYQRLGGKIKRFVKATNYEKKEVGRLRTGAEMAGRSAFISAIGSVGGLAVGAGTQNYMAGMAAYNAIVTGLALSPVGKVNIYFKKENKGK